MDDIVIGVEEQESLVELLFGQNLFDGSNHVIKHFGLVWREIQIYNEDDGVLW